VFQEVPVFSVGCGRDYAFYGTKERVFIGTQGVARDITERKRTEEALRKSEAKFRSAFLTSPDSVNINRMSDGLFKDVNDAFLRIMGYDKEEVLGRSSVELDIWADIADRKRMVRNCGIMDMWRIWKQNSAARTAFCE